MAKTYTTSGDAGQNTGESQSLPSSSPYTKFIPVVVGLLALVLIIGAIMRGRTASDTVPSASAGKIETTGPAARPNGPAGGQER